jgi:hypothetical protein
MKHAVSSTIVAVLFAVAGCGAGDEGRSDVSDAGSTAGTSDRVAAATAAEAPAATFKPGAEPVTSTAKIGDPITIAYRMIGQPVIGQPLTIDLRISSVSGAQPVRVDYRIVDASALQLAESQLQYATVDPVAGDEGASEQVTVVPLREGRLYLNVAASIDTEQGAMSTVTAIPIQVGSTARVTEDNGELSRDASGETVRVLDGSED